MKRAVVVVTLALAATSAAAQATFDVPVALARAERATVATVELVPAMSQFIRALDEPAMRRAACRYTIDDPAAIRSLVTLVRSADVRATPTLQRLDLRAGLRFTDVDGAQVDVLLQDNYGGTLPVLGTLRTSTSGDLRSTAITARAPTMTDLRAWIAARGVRGEGGNCPSAP